MSSASCSLLDSSNALTAAGEGEIVDGTESDAEDAAEVEDAAHARAGA